uniref:Uncharacterized protein n=1 Tax=Picea glauca TaxID=3330 RepID=A0A101LYJ6_PICGL|nr:hypothetical protein ABT39_MTgene5899 [Picea glauca]
MSLRPLMLSLPRATILIAILGVLLMPLPHCWWRPLFPMQNRVLNFLRDQRGSTPHLPLLGCP